ncbi:MAG: hypothetical protein HYY25_02155 [Candidatus Wallbacteria bacterium]|nr:hypothetical protein [Candidatus Wallbacteria bacterium]
MAPDRKARRLHVLRLGAPGGGHGFRALVERAVHVLVVLAVVAAVGSAALVAHALWVAMQRVPREAGPAPGGPATAPPPAERELAGQRAAPAGREPTAEDREAFSEASYLEGSPAPPTIDEVSRRVRAYYHSRGVREETFLAMSELDEADCAYQDALLEARSRSRAGDAREAVRLLRASLEAQDPRHLVARLRLLEALETVARHAGDTARARAAHAEVLVLREQIARATLRALAEAGAADPVKPADLMAHLKRDASLRRELLDRLCRDGTLEDALATVLKAGEAR